LGLFKLARVRWDAKSALRQFSAELRRAAGRVDLVSSLLAVCALAITIWLAVDLAVPSGIGTPAGETLPLPAKAESPRAERQSNVGTYLAAIANPRLFRYPEKPKPASPAKEATQRALGVPSIAGFLELAGIIGGENPQAVLRDRRNGDTYFVSKGEAVSDVTIKEVRERSVVLQVADGEIELGL
jgi:hypothetical protein